MSDIFEFITHKLAFFPHKFTTENPTIYVFYPPQNKQINEINHSTSILGRHDEVILSQSVIIIKDRLHFI